MSIGYKYFILYSDGNEVDSLVYRPGKPSTWKIWSYKVGLVVKVEGMKGIGGGLKSPANKN